MPSISLKGQTMPDSPIRKLAPFATKAKEAGKRVIHLNIGQPDIATPEVALEAVRSDTRTVIEYSPSEGFASYREGLAAYYRSVHVNVSAEEILVTTGGSEALVFAFMSCLDPGDEVIVPEPFYANYNGFAQMAGVHIVPVTAHIDDGFALPPIEDFEAKITQRTKAVLLCNPGNPTGTVYSGRELNALASLVQEHDLYLFADEVYREFCYDGATPKSVMQLEGLDQHVVLVDSVSKRYSMCGARIGCLVTKNKQVHETALKFAQARLSPPTYAQIASEAALDTPDSYFDEVIEEYMERRNILIQELQKITGLKVAKPKGAFYCIVELPISNADAFAQWLLEAFRVENETIMMAPAAGFYATPGLGKNQLRIAYVLKKEDLIKSVNILKQGLKVYKNLE